MAVHSLHPSYSLPFLPTPTTHPPLPPPPPTPPAARRDNGLHAPDQKAHAGPGPSPSGARPARARLWRSRWSKAHRIQQSPCCVTPGHRQPISHPSYQPLVWEDGTRAFSPQPHTPTSLNSVPSPFLPNFKKSPLHWVVRGLPIKRSHENTHLGFGLLPHNKPLDSPGEFSVNGGKKGVSSNIS